MGTVITLLTVMMGRMLALVMMVTMAKVMLMVECRR